MRVVCLLTLMSASLVAGCASSKGESYALAGYDFTSLNRVAIVEVTGRVYGDVVKNQISDFFIPELMKRGYGVIERRGIPALLKEQEFQASDLTSNTDAARAGRILNVEAVLVINIPKYEDKMEMTAKLIDVEDASILWIGNGSGSTGKGLATFVGAAAGAAAGAVLAGGDTSDRVIGGVAGNALSPEQSEQVKKVIAKVCDTMPSRIPQVQKK